MRMGQGGGLWPPGPVSSPWDAEGQNFRAPPAVARLKPARPWPPGPRAGFAALGQERFAPLAVAPRGRRMWAGEAIRRRTRDFWGRSARTGQYIDAHVRAGGPSATRQGQGGIRNEDGAPGAAKKWYLSVFRRFLNAGAKLYPVTCPPC